MGVHSPLSLVACGEEETSLSGGTCVWGGAFICIIHTKGKGHVLSDRERCWCLKQQREEISSQAVKRVFSMLSITVGAVQASSVWSSASWDAQEAACGLPVESSLYGVYRANFVVQTSEVFLANIFTCAFAQGQNEC